MKSKIRIALLRGEDFIPWYSVEELEWWLAQSTISEREYQAEFYDCDNFTRDLATEAMRDNRMIGIYRDRTGETPHLLNFTVINNELYLIEPQTDEVTYKNDIDKSIER